MANTSVFVKRINNYKKCMKILSCANRVYIEEINNFEFKKISKYNKSKNLYNKIVYDFELVNELIERKDLLNAATILRTLYENIIYVIAMSYDNKIEITLKTSPKDLRSILENNCGKIFSSYFEKEDFNEIYKYLCKIVHPSSLKEILSDMTNSIKYENYLLNNLKYIMVIIEYLYLNFLNKRIGKQENDFYLNFIDVCTYVNLVNINYFLYDVKDDKSFVKKYFYYDTEKKFITESQDKIKEVYEIMSNEKQLVEENIKNLTKNLAHQIKNSKYNEIIEMMLKEK